MSGAPILILGCGYTGARVAIRLVARGERVIAVSREPEKLQHLEGVQAIRFGDPLPIEPGTRVLLHRFPPGHRDAGPWNGPAERADLLWCFCPAFDRG